MGLFMQAVGALAVVYGLSHGCSYVKESFEPKPFVRGVPIDKSKDYTVWQGNTRMTLPGYELDRRPPEMSIEFMLGKEVAIARTKSQ